MLPIARVIVADPAWEFGDSLPGDTRGAEKNYNVMSTKDICALRIPPVEGNALLFLWRVSSMLEDAIRVCRAWGFTPKSEITWVKLTKGADRNPIRTQVRQDHLDVASNLTQAAMMRLALQCAPLHFGMGRFVRNSHESCLIAARGAGASLIRSHSERSVFFAPVGEHSAKPDVFYEIVERLSAGPYVELFARRQRLGWHCIGDALGTKLVPRGGR